MCFPRTSVLGYHLPPLRGSLCGNGGFQLVADSPARWNAGLLSGIPTGCHFRPITRRHFVENLNTVVWWNFSPGFRIVVGKSG